MSTCVPESQFLSFEQHSFFVLVLTLKVWKVPWRVRWTNQSPGVGPSRTCTEGTTCPPLWATVCPALEDILHFGKCLNERDALAPQAPPCLFSSWVDIIVSFRMHLSSPVNLTNISQVFMVCFLGQYSRALHNTSQKHHVVIQQRR